MPLPTHRYIATREGWLYLAVVLSLQTRQVLGYSLADRMPDDLVEQAFLNAWQRSPGIAASCSTQTAAVNTRVETSDACSPRWASCRA